MTSTKNMLYLAAAAGLGYYVYTNYIAAPMAPPVAAAPSGPQTALQQLQLPAQSPAGIPGTAAATGDVKNAAAPNSTAEKYYGVGGVEFKAQGLTKKHMKFGPIFGPSGMK